jgi:hypothetical protein
VKGLREGKHIQQKCNRKNVLKVYFHFIEWRIENGELRILQKSVLFLFPKPFEEIFGEVFEKPCLHLKDAKKCLVAANNEKNSNYAAAI